MAKTDLKSLIAKLNPTCRTALETAAGLCMSQTHYEVDIEHILLKLMDVDNCDLHPILRYFEINETKVTEQLTTAMGGFKSGNSRTPALSPHIPTLIKEAWIIASLNPHPTLIRSGHILLALLTSRDLKSLILGSAKELGAISAETLEENLEDLCSNSIENDGGTLTELPGSSGGGGKPGTAALDQYTVNLTEKANNNEIDPIVGRDEEIRQMVDVLIRRRQNNPILTGEAGVGKTAVVEGFAVRIATNDVPPALQGVQLLTLDLALLQAGASIKGEFEERLKNVIDEVKSSPVPIILFIDEAHTLIGAGGQGAGDAANLLKPALARGELRTIAATTWAEYKKYFEKDAALARRFQVVKIEEPDGPKAVAMMRSIGPFLEKHHQVMISDEAIHDAVMLSQRYLTGRQLPDKAVSVLDTACARVTIGLNATPPALEDVIRHISQLEREMTSLNREAVVGTDHSERLAELKTAMENSKAEQEELTARWEKELTLAKNIIELRLKIQDAEDDTDSSETLSELKNTEKELTAVQGENPLLQPSVDSQIVADVISGWTGIPAGRMQTDEINTVLNLAETLGQRVIGQDHALEAISKVIQTSHAGIDDPGKPNGVFMLVGPSGVGKTEAALALADQLYGGEQNLITINMSEYQEAHTVSSLKGSPPGYVGYGEGGVLTEAVRRKPYSVVLLDEVEKAHMDVMELFYQVFDKGNMEDGEGRSIDFKNTLIILTSNKCTDLIMDQCLGKDEMPDPDELATMMKPELNAHFKPAFLGRLKVIPFYPIVDENLEQIVRLKLDKVVKRVAENRKMVFSYDDDMVSAIAKRCTEVDSGARNIDTILSNSLLPEMSRILLAKMADDVEMKEIKAKLTEKGFEFEVN
jgi:type VI secretion system protein VasG